MNDDLSVLSFLVNQWFEIFTLQPHDFVHAAQSIPQWKDGRKEGSEEKEGNLVTIIFALSVSYFTPILCKMILYPLE